MFVKLAPSSQNERIKLFNFCFKAIILMCDVDCQSAYVLCYLLFNTKDPTKMWALIN